MMSMEDIIDILAVDLLGVVPDDETIVVSTNRGEPAVMDKNSQAGLAFQNITRRILGETVPLMNLEPSYGWFEKIKRLVTRS
jgi:septum site-determining protein MinD